ERHTTHGDDATRAQAAEMMMEGVADSGIARRPLIKGALGTAEAIAPLTVAVPRIGRLGGDANIRNLQHTAPAPAPGGGPRERATDPSGRRIKASDRTQGSIVHGQPWKLPEEDSYLEKKTKAMVLLIRVDPSILKEPEERKDWSYDGIVAYS